MKKRFLVILLFTGAFSALSAQDNHSIAREWNEILLGAIRNDFARPTVHARNLFHVSVGMYDAWAAYETKANTYFLGNTIAGYNCPFDGIGLVGDKKAAQEEAISYAAYRLIVHRFQNSPGSGFTIVNSRLFMQSHGYDINMVSTDYSTGSPAALGNYIAQHLIQFGLQDGSNEQGDYGNLHYSPANEPLVMNFPGNPTLTHPNRWQPLTLNVFIDQSGNVQPFNTPEFLSPEWGSVIPFSLTSEDLTIYNRDGNEYWVYHDPGAPPYIDVNDNDASEHYKWGFAMVSVWASHLDPSDNVLIDISPGSFGNTTALPGSLDEYENYYDFFEGGDSGMGHDLNPVTGQPYEPQFVPRGDYARVLAEFWADGPDSETPPGHWFTILNYVHDHPLFERRYKGAGPILDDLEWDVKAYFLLGGGMHDCAVSSWGIKGWYDYIRPVSAIRGLAEMGQCSDPGLPNYSEGGLPLIPGYIELVEVGDPLAGANQQHVGKVKLYTWRGHDFISNPLVDAAGVGWILAENWWPYQRPSFVTPPFAGYVSGHSTYSRAAAEILTLLTGDPFFPGGMGEFEAERNEFLVFEEGPSQDIILQWATYVDASDQTSLSRIWGGIHPPADDIPGRYIGIAIGHEAFAKADSYFIVDNDGDGYFGNDDCDDNNATINPGASESCNGIDDNCNDLVDDGLPLLTYYLDFDNDGYGDAAVSLDTCQVTAPEGFVSNDSDCNDDAADINPSVAETCNGIDDNCNGLVDEGLMLFTYYQDFDGDGFGDVNFSIDTCLATPPSGFVINASDCRDDIFLINPNAQEACDGLDNNCNGLIDDGIAVFTFYADIDNDGFGDAGITYDTCSNIPPAGFVDNALDCDDDNFVINPSIVETCNGVDDDCDGLIDNGLPKHRYYEDYDLDAYGNPEFFIDTCLQMAPAGFTSDNTDCDDDNATVYPGAMEIADNDIDEDCSGSDLYLQKKIFPNPAMDRVTIHMDYQEPFLLEVINSKGQILVSESWRFTQNSLSFDISELSSGLYFIRLRASNGKRFFIEKIIKL